MIHMPITRERSLQELLFHWKTVCNRANDDWTRDFSRSISSVSKRRNWNPTPKQLGIMQRLVSDLFIRRTDGDADAKVIE